uniref:NGFI-A-binding protein homolog n=1 Tax=Glossina brevipalpis TaxID=37001 RepID=A0A1A9WLK7_9MUSC
MDSSTGNSLSTTNTTSATTCLNTNTTTTNNITSVSASITSSISSTSNLPASGSLSSLTTAAVCATSSSSSSLPLPTPLLQVLPLDTGKQDDSNNLSLASGISEGQRSLSAAPSASSSPILSPPGKIFGRNANGTMVATSRPSNEAEVQLYRVLQKASLLAYYDTLLEMGGDDVQQLYEAGEEEFLEIMALVGMASKPLHVRRLQKALHEWASNPQQFQTPITNNSGQFDTPAKSSVIFNTEPSPSHCAPRPKFPPFNPTPTFNPTPLMNTVPPSTSAHLLSQICSLPATIQPPSGPLIVPPAGPLPNERPHPLLASQTTATASGVTHSSTSHQVTSSSPQLTPVLSEMQVARITVGAEKIAAQLPQREPRAHTSKKRTSRELEQVIAMSEHDPRRMDEIRKYSAIYGRFDCKRRPEKPLTLHEVCVNEAAAQLCRLVPALLTRRDELFPLARQIVKDAGFGHSASIARYGNLLTQMTQNPAAPVSIAGTIRSSIALIDCESNESNSTPLKRQRLTSTDALANLSGSDNNRDLNEDSRYNLFAMYQKFAAKAPFDLTDIAKFSLNKPNEFEEQDNESRFSFSNSSSPPTIPNNGPEDERITEKSYSRADSINNSTDLHCSPSSNNNNNNNNSNNNNNNNHHHPFHHHHHRLTIETCSSSATKGLSSLSSGGEVQVISASGNHIIAVANPALIMSPTLTEAISLKRETDSPDL